MLKKHIAHFMPMSNRLYRLAVKTFKQLESELKQKSVFISKKKSFFDLVF